VRSSETLNSFSGTGGPAAAEVEAIERSAMRELIDFRVPQLERLGYKKLCRARSMLSAEPVRCGDHCDQLECFRRESTLSAHARVR
jgi:hypothetical protein